MSNKPKPEQCPNNEWVFCHQKTCGSCGWNPKVAVKRQQDIKAKSKSEKE